MKYEIHPYLGFSGNIIHEEVKSEQARWENPDAFPPSGPVYLALSSGLGLFIRLIFIPALSSKLLGREVEKNS